MNLWLHQKLFSKCCWPCCKSSRLQPKADNIVRDFFFPQTLKIQCLRSHIATQFLPKVNTDTNEFRCYNIYGSWRVPSSCSRLWVNLAQLHDIYTGPHKVKDFYNFYIFKIQPGNSYFHISTLYLFYAVYTLSHCLLDHFFFYQFANQLS